MKLSQQIKSTAHYRLGSVSSPSSVPAPTAVYKTQIKICPKCKKSYPITAKYFSRNRTRKDGFDCWCKLCCKQLKKQWNKQYYQQNREKILRHKQQYDQQHRKEQKEHAKKYYNSITGHIRRIWNGMFRRCNNPKFKQYKDYGGRGIKIKFNSFEDFYNYIIEELKADPRGLTIDRINNDGHYEPGNIRFITRAENNKNRNRISLNSL